MAAHGLTILRQIRARILANASVADVAQLAEDALGAPGMCFTRGFDLNLWDRIDRTVDRMSRGDVVTTDVLLAVVEQGIQEHLWMDAYPSMEAVEAAMARYLRVGRPYWKTRSRLFDAGDPATHAKARAMIVDRYPLSKRAPTVGP